MTLSEQIKQLLEKTVEIEGKKIQLSHLLITTLIKKAIKGDMKALNTILDYTQTKPEQKIEISAKDGSAIEIDNVRAIQLVDERINEIIGSGKNSDSSLSD